MKKCGFCISFSAAMMLLTSCSSYTRSHIPANHSDKSDLYQVLYYASLAGSSHNSQPWRAEVYGEDSILVFADTTRMLPVVDPSGRELYISVGAFIENLTVAAGCLGYIAGVSINKQDPLNESPVASIRLTRSGTKTANSALEEIKNRVTIRTPFDTMPIKMSDLAILIPDDVNIHFVEAASEKGIYLSQKTLAAYEQQAHDQEAMDELSGWVRFSNKEVREKLDGLTTAGMGIRGMGGFVVRNFYKPEDSKTESFVTKGVEKTRQQVENCGGWVVITQEADNAEGWVNTGRLYQRVHLKCRKLSIGLQPMNQIPEESEFERDAGLFLTYSGQIMFVARVGYVKDYPEPVSVRRPVERFAVFR